MRDLILFDTGTTDITSRVFMVPVGQIVVLSAWGFSGAKLVPEPNENKATPQLAIVQKLAFPGGSFPDGSPCDDISLSSEPEYTFVEDVTQCGLWALSACRNLVAIAVPGVYRLQLNDIGAVGSVFVTATAYSKRDAAPFPTGMFLGE